MRLSARSVSITPSTLTAPRQRWRAARCGVLVNIRSASRTATTVSPGGARGRGVARGSPRAISVKSAEAEAESKYLAGVGVARQRKAIVDGLKNSISDFTSNEQIKGASSKDVVDLLLITQYFDMLNAIGTRPDTQTVFIDEDGE